MIRRLAPLVPALLAACAVAPEREPTDGTPDPVPTPPAPTLPPCVTAQPFGSGALFSAWAAPDGTVYAAGSPGLRVRSPGGAWSDEALPFRELTALAGAPDGTLWALTPDTLVRRDGPGAWSAIALPIVGDPRSLVVLGADTVEVLVTPEPERSCDDCYFPDGNEVWTWSAGTWTGEVLPETDVALAQLAHTPAGDRLVTDGRTVSLIGAAGLAPLPAPTGLERLATAPDGTIVGIGETVAVGTVAGGLVENRPPTSAYAFSAVWVGGADAIVVASVDWDAGVLPRLELWSWDGAAWTALVDDRPGDLYAIVGTADALVAVGASEHRLVFAGDRSRMALEEESWGVDGLVDLAADRVRGEAYGYGFARGQLAWFDGSAWQAIPVAGVTGDFHRIAAADGVAVAVSGDALVRWDGAAATVEPLDEAVFWYALAATEGAQFLLGRDREEGAAGPLRVHGLVNTGGGWVAMDTSGFPEDAEPHTAWADGPTDLYVGVERPGRAGGVVHWDGVAWSLVADGLDADPGWLSRESDGALYLTQFSEPAVGDPSLFRLGEDGAAVGLEGLPPDIRSAHLEGDGAWLVAAYGERFTSDPEDGELYARILEGTPEGGFTELTEAYRAVLAAVDGVVWSATTEAAWTRDTRACTP